jgi:hypothetical protein
VVEIERRLRREAAGTRSPRVIVLLIPAGTAAFGALGMLVVWAASAALLAARILRLS